MTLRTRFNTYLNQQNPVDAPPESRGTTRIRRTPTESCLHLQCDTGGVRIVKFTSYWQRKEFFDSRKNDTVFIAEDLTDKRANLLYQARELCCKGLLKYCWTWDGSVFVQRLNEADNKSGNPVSKMWSLHDLLPFGIDPSMPLRWRHNERDGVSNHQPHRIVYSTLYSGADQRKHQRSTSLAFVRGIHRWPVNSSHKGPVTRKMFPFYDLLMLTA